MTLDKHTIQGIPPISAKTLPVADFEQLMVNAGYIRIGSAPAKGNRVKVWWSHPTFPRVESIYSSDMQVAITAYHV
ncbi:hypothetical protein [Argonema galeatum]|uniref:hypothetical protein n=1 Tax=Argonema galeatum TaxID=2942762 RepID=UPI0020124296|nr:hypothetical protein [Argonema galeatum]MCL1465602.1 hypothetical protein [Argonema galeatum A003/A1]